LIAAGVGRGDEVITVPMTFVATSWAISYCGARPVFVDVDPAGYTMDPNQVADQITSRTKAIMPVHLYGQPADLGPLRQIADRYLTMLHDLPLDLPCVRADREHVWHLFVVRHPDRDRIRAALEEWGIQTGLHYPIPVHLQPAYRDLGYKPGDFPVSERIGRECFTLPLYPEMTEEQQDAVVEGLTDAVLKEGWR